MIAQLEGLNELAAFLQLRALLAGKAVATPDNSLNTNTTSGEFLTLICVGVSDC
jgi:hypothetical protein